MTARAERVPAEEVRQRMLDAGRELAIEAGAALTIEHLRLEEVIQRARVPRSSVYRLWSYRDEYIDDLLCYLAGAGHRVRQPAGVRPGDLLRRQPGPGRQPAPARHRRRAPGAAAGGRAGHHQAQLPGADRVRAVAAAHGAHRHARLDPQRRGAPADRGRPRGGAAAVAGVDGRAVRLPDDGDRPAAARPGLDGRSSAAHRRPAGAVAGAAQPPGPGGRRRLPRRRRSTRCSTGRSPGPA